MGTQIAHQCESCGTSLEISEGGGFVFDLLHCDRCGEARGVGHDEMGEIHLGYVKGLPEPYAVNRAESDDRLRRDCPGEPLTEAEYQVAVEGIVASCDCGGSFRYEAPAQCPGCGSTREQWTEGVVQAIYD